jgi:transcriptional regulator
MAHPDRVAPSNREMYLPGHFREGRREILHEFIERHPLGTLVTVAQGSLRADHVPMLLVHDPGGHQTLHGHVARANRLWRDVQDGTDVLVIFGGADAYVSPSWYPSKAATGQVVPTWNYAVAHVRGKIRFFEAPDRLHALVASLTERNERTQPVPWSIDDAPEAYVQAQLKAIVGFEIEILELVGKFKSSQNRPAEDRAGVRKGLQRLGAEALDELVREPASKPVER